jgi:hypothetical protein
VEGGGKHNFSASQGVFPREGRTRTSTAGCCVTPLQCYNISPPRKTEKTWPGILLQKQRSCIHTTHLPVGLCDLSSKPPFTSQMTSQ